MFLNTSPPSHSVLKAERPPGIQSHIYQCEELTGSLLLLEHLSLKERSEVVQGKNKLLFKLRVDPLWPKASA